MYTSHLLERAPFASINITPLVGMLCALISLFALSAHDVRSSNIPISSPDGPPCFLPMSLPIELKIDDSEVFYWNGTRIDRRQLAGQLEILSEMKTQPSIVISPRGSTTYQQLTDLLDQLDSRSLVRRNLAQAR